MKRLLVVLLIFIVTFVIVSCFIPATREKQVFVSTPFDNVVKAVFQARNWIKWDSSIDQDWMTDSAKYSFQEDSARHSVTIETPEKRIQVTQVTYLLYQLEESKNNRSSLFSLSIIPFVGNGNPRSEHNTTIAYAQRTNLLYKTFPFLERTSFAEKTVSNLKSYLDNTTRFYGYPIQLQRASDTLFLTEKASFRKQDLFKKLPVLFRGLDSFASIHHTRPTNRNISFDVQRGDSLSLLAGINISQEITGDYLFNFMQLPMGQILVTGHFEGRFSERSLLYNAMEKFILDHQLIKSSVSFEKYLSDLPTSDSSFIKIDLSYPLRY